MKILKVATRILAIGLALAAIVAFFFPYATAVSGGENLSFTGAELAFGSTKGEVKVDQSLYFMFMFIFAAIALLLAAMSLKFGRSMWGGLLFGLFAFFVNIAIFTVAPNLRVDTHPLPDVSGVAFAMYYWVGLALQIATILISLLSIFIADQVDAKAANRPTIPQRIVKFFRDYKSEIKKIIWPSRKTTMRNTIIVLVMCAVAGGFVWLLDFGLARLVGLVLQINL